MTAAESVPRGLRQRLMRVVSHELAVRREVFILASRAVNHPHIAGGLCGVCRSPWPCQPVLRAAQPVFAAIAGERESPSGVIEVDVPAHLDPLAPSACATWWVAT